MTDDLTWVVTGIDGGDLLMMAIDEEGNIHRRRRPNCTIQWAEITVEGAAPFLAPVMAIAEQDHGDDCSAH